MKKSKNYYIGNIAVNCRGKVKKNRLPSSSPPMVLQAASGLVFILEKLHNAGCV